MPSVNIPIDYESAGQHPAVREARPVVSMQDGAYCCMSGPNPVEGIFGFGVTLEEAVNGWIRSYENMTAKRKTKK